MRWDNLRLVERPRDDGLTAPLFEQGAVVRTFDTPEFRGITFYEVRARSIINRVPDASRVPFRWTINPYRGCSHGCTYCISGETPILMADGRTRPLADVRAGDSVYGTVRRHSVRRYAVTPVLAHWQTVKPAYRITLEDGTELVASGDHRFLSDHGWRHVTGRAWGRDRRPFLTIDDKLIGTGRFASPPEHDADYWRGYLCGTIRSGRYVSSRASAGPARTRSDHPHVQPAPADFEAPRRAPRFLGLDVITPEFAFQETMIRTRGMSAIRTSSSGGVVTMPRILPWPVAPTDQWRRGFLAGMFDAEGGSGTVERVWNNDRAILDMITSCLRGFRFPFVVEPPGANDVAVVRLLGGLRECLRFFHTVDPGISGRRSIEGLALESDPRLRVLSIEPLGMDLPMYDITTGTGDFIANGVVSHNCFARNTHTYLDLDYGEDFNSQIVVKVNAPELLRKELSARSWRGEHIAMGTNVDPYQRAEGRYRLMRGILEGLRDFANPFSILTKGSLILRDLDLLQQCAQVAEVGTNVSVGSVDREVWRSLEPGTPSPQKRLEVCRTLNQDGIPCGVLMAPIIPFLTDAPSQIEATVQAIAEAGATHVAPIVLHLRTGAREWFMQWVADQHPELVERYERLYPRSAYAPKAYQEEITGRVHELAEKFGIGMARRKDGRRVQRQPVPDPGEQLTLL